ncbi:hypothetical protein V8E36_007524 [Tilletia maclaganii]
MVQQVADGTHPETGTTTASSSLSAVETAASSEPTEPPLECSSCGESFAGQAQLQTHRRKEHSGSIIHNVKVYGWDTTRDVRREHRSGVNGTAAAFHCPKCDNPFEIPSNLRKHCGRCKNADNVVLRVTLQMLQDTATPGDTSSYRGPNSTQLSLWEERHTAATLLKDQDLTKMRQLLLLPKDDFEEHKEDRASYPQLVGSRILWATDDALRCLRLRLGGLSAPWLQVLASANTADAYKTRPMRINLAAQRDYDRHFKENVAFFVRLFYKCYGDEFDVDEDPMFNDVLPLEKGLDTVMQAFIDTEHVFKSIVHDIISTRLDTAYWRLGYYLLTSSVPANATSSLLHLLVPTHVIADPVRGSFKSAVDFTPTLSRMIYMAKVCWAGDELERLRADVSDPLMKESWHPVAKLLHGQVLKLAKYGNFL